MLRISTKAVSLNRPVATACRLNLRSFTSEEKSKLDAAKEKNVPESKDEKPDKEGQSSKAFSMLVDMLAEGGTNAPAYSSQARKSSEALLEEVGYAAQSSKKMPTLVDLGGDADGTHKKVTLELDSPQEFKYISENAKKYATSDIVDDGWMPQWSQIAEKEKCIPEEPTKEPDQVDSSSEELVADLQSASVSLDDKEQKWLKELVSQVNLAVKRNPTYSASQREKMVQDFSKLNAADSAQ
eukprot:CFRG1168T1